MGYKNVVYLVADSLRADYVGCYGNDAVQTPTLDSLAAEGVRFENVVSSAPWTVPSVATHLTGSYPHRLGVFSADTDLDANDELETVFESVKNHGYTTGAFIDSHKVYEQWDDHVDTYGMSVHLKDTLDFISDNADGPFYLFNLYRGTHLPYVLKYSSSAWYHAVEQRLDKLRSGDPNDLEEVKYWYRRSVEQFSEWYLSAIIDRLREEDILDETIIVVTSDHGEVWGEDAEDRSEFGTFDLHGPHLSDEVLKVPLVLSNFDQESTTVTDRVRSIDVVPTVLTEALGEDDSNRDGIPLQDLAEGASTDRSDTAYAATTTVENPETFDITTNGKMAVYDGDWKLVEDFQSGTTELYNVVDDPDEVDDLSQTRSDKRDELSRLISEEIDSNDLRDAEPSDDLRDHLEDLGYL